MRIPLSIVCICLTVVLGAGSVAAADDNPPFKIKTKRDHDQVKIQVEKQQTIFTVHSPSGIGEATIERTDEKRPNKILLRLHLKGLEHFQVAVGQIKVTAAFSSQDATQQLQLVQPGQKEVSIDPHSPFWMPIRLLDQAGQPTKTIPLKEGCFEASLPQKLFEENPRSIKLTWIDFYRN